MYAVFYGGAAWKADTLSVANEALELMTRMTLKGKRRKGTRDTSEAGLAPSRHHKKLHTKKLLSN